MKKRFKPNYNIKSEPIVLSKVTSDILLKQEKPSDVLALYLFYYITSKWQDQKNAYCTTSYTAKGIKWSETRVRKTKKVLIRLGLIEDVCKRGRSGKIIQHYIKVNFKWVKEDVMDHPVRNSGGGFDEGVVDQGSNTTLLVDKIQPNSKLNVIDKSITVRPKINGKSSLKENNNTIYFKLAKKLSKIIRIKKNITHTTVQIKAWSEELRKLDTVNKVNSTRQKEVLKWYKKAIGGKYVPVVESGKTFRDKFTKLEDAMSRDASEHSNNFGYKGKYKVTKKASTL